VVKKIPVNWAEVIMDHVQVSWSQDLR
jgi:hypothetical protein